MRLFVAIDLPEDVRKAVAAAQARCRRLPWSGPVSWTKIENLHLTLQFLGEVESAAVAGISAALETVAGNFAPFAVAVRGGGVFPDARRPRVLWVGCEAERLPALVAAVQDGLRPLGFWPEPRPFAAHLTLARLRQARPDAALTRALESLTNQAFGTLRVEAIHLYQSQLHPAGSIYTRLFRHPLRGESSHAGQS